MADIAVIGAGKIGGTLGRKWAAAGHAVTFGARDPRSSTLLDLAEEIGAETAPIPDAAGSNEVVAFAIPGAAMDDTASALGSLLDGKIVIDATNNLRGSVTNGAGAVAAAAPGASYFRAFNTLGWELFDRPVVGGVQADLFFCGPNGDPRATVEGLIADVGLRPVWMGGPEEVEVVDGLLRAWITLVRRGGRGRHMAFKLIED
jgi:predicted dinucleotide-binding enzyme